MMVASAQARYPRRMKAIYHTRYAIPEIGAEPGDHVVAEPSHPEDPVQVVKSRDRQALAWLMGEGHLDRMQLVAGDLGRTSPPPLRPGRGRILHLVSEDA